MEDVEEDVEDVEEDVEEDEGIPTEGRAEVTVKSPRTLVSYDVLMIRYLSWPLSWLLSRPPMSPSFPFPKNWDQSVNCPVPRR